VPIPIQSGSLSDRLRKFFRIRGKTGFVLDEVVAPVVLVQDLTEGPYQAGVTPAAGVQLITLPNPGDFATFVVIMNDKPGSLTPVLDRQFNDRSFSFTYAEAQNISFPVTELDDMKLSLALRADVVAAGVPLAASNLVSIQNNDGTIKVPVEIFTYNVVIPSTLIWRGLLGDNTNTLGSRRIFDDIKPNITIGPEDALIFASGTAITAGPVEMFFNARGFYQEQPA